MIQISNYYWNTINISLHNSIENNVFPIFLRLVKNLNKIKS